MIEATLKLIKEQIGLDLKLCDYFTGIRSSQNGLFFNVILKDRLPDSKEYAQLLSFSNKYKMIKVEPNGLRRVAIFNLTSNENQSQFQPKV